MGKEISVSKSTISSYPDIWEFIYILSCYENISEAA